MFENRPKHKLSNQFFHYTRPQNAEMEMYQFHVWPPIKEHFQPSKLNRSSRHANATSLAQRKKQCLRFTQLALNNLIINCIYIESERAIVLQVKPLNIQYT